MKVHVIVRVIVFTLLMFVCGYTTDAQIVVSGIVADENGNSMEFATVSVKGTTQGTTTDAKGRFSLSLAKLPVIVVAQSMGYVSAEQEVTIRNNNSHLKLVLKNDNIELKEVTVESVAGIGSVRRSPYNSVALDATTLYNDNKNLGDALSKAPGVKLRETGGVGSDIQVSLDGFSGSHVRLFIDGVPQEGANGSFGLNNLPIEMAERIEVYRGVVPVQFGADAIGGVINVVTKRQRKGWHADASYTYGSFNTHKAYADFGMSTEKGFVGMIKLIANYSDNNYKIRANVEDFSINAINRKKFYTVKHFNDTYHNEAVQVKLGVAHKPWADRLIGGFTYSRMYKEIQTGVYQIVVYGAKYREGWSAEPTIEYKKSSVANGHLDFSLSAKYNYGVITNVDTSAVKYNWFRETQKMNSAGEQSYQNSDSKNYTFSAIGAIDYRIATRHLLSLTETLNKFKRRNVSNIGTVNEDDIIDKITIKSIAGLSYAFAYNDKLNFSAFGKYYFIGVSGPMETSDNSSQYVEVEHDIDFTGYGAAATVRPQEWLQLKLSYERACRLPTINEMFGDDDLENGDISIKPERSNNFNFGLSLSHKFSGHGFYFDGGLIYRKTDDYIQRNIVGLSGGKKAASYVNYGKVETKGYNISIRYDYNHRLSVGGSYNSIDVRDKQKTIMGSTGENVAYNERMPNLPYRYADADASYKWHNVIAQGNTLSIGYDLQYVHEFCYNAANVGTANKSEYMVPKQLSYNANITYIMLRGMLNFAFEAKNITDEELYDNFRLQKAGRAFYGKIRVQLGTDIASHHHSNAEQHRHSSHYRRGGNSNDTQQ